MEELGGPIDLHVHLLGAGDAGTGCHISPRVERSFLFSYLVWLLGLRRRGRTLDESYRERLAHDLREAPIARAVVLAQDGRYDREGKLDLRETHLLVPNDYVLAFAREHGERVIPCPSINPDRRDARDELERVVAAGAVILKVHPPIQGVDPADPRHRPFWRRVAELDVILMVHTGHEHSTPIHGQQLGDPRRLAPALEEGCTVIAAHSGTASVIDREDFFPHFEEMLARHPRLHGDSAVLASVLRPRAIPRLLESPRTLARVLHGSDYPLPPNPWIFVRRLGIARAARLARERNMIARDLAIKRALGVPEESATRAWDLLAPRLARRRGGR